MRINRFSRLVLPAGIVIGFALAGCSLVSGGKPVAVITSPPSGTQVDPNSQVLVQVNASDNQGIVRIDLLVNDVVVASENAPGADGQPTFSAVLRWTPNTTGQQVVQARAYNRNGAVSAPVAINILVRDVRASTTGTPTEAPTLTPSPTATVQASDTPAAAVSSPTALPPITVVVPPPQPPQPSQPQQPSGPTTPSKPSNFQANGTGTTISFTWDDKSTNELGFRIYEQGTVAPVLTIPAHVGTGGMSYDWTNQPCGFTGTFFIRAYNDKGESDSSSSEKTVTVPCVPTNLIAQNSASSILFNWGVAAVHNEAGFRLYEQGVPQPIATRGPNLGSGGTNIPLSNLACNIFAWYFVRAYNTAGESPNSNLVLGETVPCAPSGLHETNATKLVVEFSFTDNATNETGFHVYRESVLESTLQQHLAAGSVSTAEVQQCGSTHVYTVKAFNPVGESASSNNLTILSPAC